MEQFPRSCRRASASNSAVKETGTYPPLEVCGPEVQGRANVWAVCESVSSSHGAAAGQKAAAAHGFLLTKRNCGIFAGLSVPGRFHLRGNDRRYRSTNLMSHCTVAVQKPPFFEKFIFANKLIIDSPVKCHVL